MTADLCRNGAVTYSFDETLPIHSSFTLIDPSVYQNSNPGKVWSFNYNASTPWMMGTAAQIDSRNNYTATGQHLDVMTWSQDAAGNPYISQTDTYLDMGTANQRHSYTTTTLDSHGYGNVISSQVYDYAAPGYNSPLLRTTTTTYLNDAVGSYPYTGSQYAAAYIRNRVYTQTVTPAGGQPITLASNTYDYYSAQYPYGFVGDAPNLQQHDANMGTSVGLRGNVTRAVTPSGTTTSGYDIEGNVVYSTDPRGNPTSVAVDNYGNVPQTVTPSGNGDLSTSFSFNTFLGPTSVSQPSNGTSAGAHYDTHGRVSSTWSPDGAGTNYYYCPDSCSPGFSLPATRNGQNNSRIAVTNTRWSRDQYDGLGRVIRTDRGDTNGNVISNVDTNYDSCACSPTGKMVSTSQPYAPGASVYWTTYAYDGLGRTIQVTAADNASHTSYAYYGSTSAVTDPAGNWKALTTDVDSNLVSVIEPDPAYSTAVPTSAQSCAAAPTGMLGTCYTYDTFKNLTRVDMYRSGYDQVRTFTYQLGTKWLQSATNPENGTVTYTRDAMGHVITRSAPGVGGLPQVTTYSYDGYNRLAQVTRSQPTYSGQGADPCQGENYYYDQSIDPTFSSGASWGKLTAVVFSNGSGGVCPGPGPDGSTWGGIVYEYQYASSGRATGKRMVVTRGVTNSGAYQANLDAYWTYDNEGRVLTVQYPVVTDPNTGNPTGTAYDYTYDTMGRPSTMVNDPNDPDPTQRGAFGVQYNASDQMTAISYGVFGYCNPQVNESRSYNVMNQVTSLSANWGTNPYGYTCVGQSFSEQYVYTAGQNNGQISSAVEGTGETVGYQYDKLKRLIAANSTAGWAQQYTYDGFGNMTFKTGSFNMQADPATNHLIGSLYDANGNMLGGYNWSYDAENRLVNVGGEQYMYDPSNKRIYKQNGAWGTGETYFFYGVDGKVMGEYTVGGLNWDWVNNVGVITLNRTTESAYFGGKKVLPGVARDRLGSVRAGNSGANRPYGENYGTQNADGFATYYQDASTGLNYADQRYYNATFGRFMTADPYQADDDGSDRPEEPGSWNRYAYVLNDAITFYDPEGLFAQCPPGTHTGSNGTTCVGRAQPVGPIGDPPTPPGKAGGGVGGGGSRGTGGRPTDVGLTTQSENILSTRLANFGSSNCNKVFGKAISGYNAGGLQNAIGSTGFYNANSLPDSSYTQNQVSGNGDSTTLGNTLGYGVAAQTIWGSQGNAVILGANYFSNTNQTYQGNVLLHEVLHAYLHTGDDGVFSIFAKYGLQQLTPGSEDISAWLSTDCNYTPTSETWWSGK